MIMTINVVIFSKLTSALWQWFKCPKICVLLPLILTHGHIFPVVLPGSTLKPCRTQQVETKFLGPVFQSEFGTPLSYFELKVWVGSLDSWDTHTKNERDCYLGGKSQSTGPQITN